MRINSGCLKQHVEYTPYWATAVKNIHYVSGFSHDMYDPTESRYCLKVTNLTTDLLVFDQGLRVAVEAILFDLFSRIRLPLQTISLKSILPFSFEKK